MQRLAIFGDLLDFDADPGFGPPQAVGTVGSEGAIEGAPRFDADTWLLIEDGRIAGRSATPPDASWTRIEHRGRLVMPGFIDTHVHAPQIDVIASYGAALLDWLETYTFPAELRHADAAVAAEASALFLDALLMHGSTAAVVFPTVHEASAHALFAAASARGMRIIAGKVLMDRHAPPGLLDADVESARAASRRLIERWHGQGRNAYAVTPRFAPTSSDAQLAMAGELLQTYPGLYMHTHVAETPDEGRWVAELFPQARSYLDVYDRHGLLGPRAVLAHGIWLDDADRERLAACGAQVAHCPTSNTFLGSGLLDWPGLNADGVAVSLGSDVGGGLTLSMPRTLAEAYKVQALRGRRLSAWKALHAATRGAARALGLAHEIGSLDAGCAADVVVWDWAVGPVARRRDALARDLHERAFAWMMLADERNVVATFVAGRERYRRDAAAG